jgi:hypothetical protein
MQTMGTHANHGDPWKPMGTHGNPWEPMGTLWRPMWRNPWEPMEPHGNASTNLLNTFHIARCCVSHLS